MADKVAIVVGVTGIVGFNLAKYLLQKEWKVYGISRTKREFIPAEVHHVALDLTDKDACLAVLAGLTNVKYVFYATWQNMSSEEENCKVNQSMMENLIDNLPSKLKHFVLVTGTKHYLGSFYEMELDELRSPFKESYSRLKLKCFYYDQEDVLFDRAKKCGFSWSVARPCTIIGFAPYNIMNVASAISVYATVCKHLNLPFAFPGSKDAYNILHDASDATLIAEHLVWQATTSAAANEAFNIVNGDISRWRFLWPVFAKYFDVRLKEPSDNEDPINLITLMADKESVWQEIVEKYKLKKTKMSELASWWFLMMIGKATTSCFSDMTKAREKGFLSYKSTEKSYIEVFDKLREENYIP